MQDVARKEKLRQATRKACATFTAGMTKPQLQQRLADVQTKLKSSVDFNGKPLKGMSERVAACKEEAARLEGLIAKAK